jgi:hypothetical protein
MTLLAVFIGFRIGAGIVVVVVALRAIVYGLKFAPLDLREPSGIRDKRRFVAPNERFRSLIFSFLPTLIARTILVGLGLFLLVLVGSVAAGVSTS